jgi:uncharacterized protein
LLGLGMTGRCPWALRFLPTPPRFLVEALKKTRRKAKADAEEGEESLATPVTFGLLTGLLPCGPLLGAELMAVGTGSAPMGALGMLAFGIGTSPLLMAFGTGASMIPRWLMKRMNFGLAIVLVIFGLVFFNRALVLVGSPVTFETARRSVMGGPTANLQSGDTWKKAPSGVVEVKVAYIDMEFVPREVRIPANTAVRLIVDRRGDHVGPATKQIAIPQLHVLQDVEASTTTPVSIPPAKAGTYALTCGMGVMEGSVVAVTP